MLDVYDAKVLIKDVYSVICFKDVYSVICFLLICWSVHIIGCFGSMPASPPKRVSGSHRAMRHFAVATVLADFPNLHCVPFGTGYYPLLGYQDC